ncbi:hypothetical protein Golax_010945 [Gossypium laxum]|uniref:CCHC-type domain-containing protein n=1 Tax=Gossypium laxum TaxID=34288 RepID=A0A7J8ZJ42_9ROSI|nr:hypothetical protein [Gossypium laxum]
MNSISSDDGKGGGDYFNEDRNTKKVYFKEARVDSDVNMVVNLVPTPRISWKDKLLEGGTVGSMAFSMDYDIIDREDFVFTNGDILQSTINGILGPWMVLRHYLTIQPWTVDFNLLQPFPSMVMVWIHIPRLLGFLSKRRVLKEIGSLVGKRNERVQWVEFESLLVVCFSCGRYGHVKGLCPSAVAYLNLSGGKEMDLVSVTEGLASMEAEEPFSPWIIIELKSRRNKKDTRIQKVNIMAKGLTRSRFDVLSLIDNGNVGAGPRVEPLCEKTEVTKVMGQVGKNGPGEPNVNMAMVKNGSSLENIGPALVMLDVQLAIEGVITVEGFGNTSLYFNPMFEGPIESVVELNFGILDPKQNSMVFFKENDDPNFTKAIIKECPIGYSKSQLASKTHGLGNCQGYANSKFPRIFHKYNREHRPDLIGLLEMRVSGGKVDSIIAKLGFLFSYHIKRMGQAIERRCSIFGDLMDSTELHDLGFRGPHFTWNRLGVFEKLDRVICNDTYNFSFPYSMVTHLPRLKSDHKPACLSPMLEFRSSRGFTFRFLAGWVKHPTFSIFVKETWKVSRSMSMAHSEFTNQKVLDCVNSVYLNQVEIENDLGDWILDNEELKLEAIIFYEKLYGKHPGLMMDLPIGVFPYLNDGEVQFLSKSVSNEEIMATLFYTTPLKAQLVMGTMLCFTRVSGSMLVPLYVIGLKGSSQEATLI